MKKVNFQLDKGRQERPKGSENKSILKKTESSVKLSNFNSPFLPTQHKYNYSASQEVKHFQVPDPEQELARPRE